MIKEKELYICSYMYITKRYGEAIYRMAFQNKVRILFKNYFNFVE